MSGRDKLLGILIFVKVIYSNFDVATNFWPRTCLFYNAQSVSIKVIKAVSAYPSKKSYI